MPKDMFVFMNYRNTLHVKELFSCYRGYESDIHPLHFDDVLIRTVVAFCFSVFSLKLYFTSRPR